MLHTLINTFRHMNHTSGFERYLMKIQRSAGAPSVEDARKDYRNIVRSETPFTW